MVTMKKTRALSLLSGGLDSLLAICVLREQGIDVTGITFVSPFFGSSNAEAAAKNLDCEIIVIDITDDHLAMVKNPPHGYGKGMNPCIDCHAMMVKKAGLLALEKGFDVLATGEVLGERPMSQNRRSLDVVAMESGFGDILVRPLSAKLLPPTKPELEGLIDRERLLDIEGRSRKRQIELAKKYGIKKYVQPAGGCLLTDPIFSEKLRDLLGHNQNADRFDIGLLTLGRQFRLSSNARLIVGRNEKENEDLLRFVENTNLGTLFISDVVPGPVAYLESKDDGDVDLAAKVCASYASHKGGEVDLVIKSNDEEKRVVVKPTDKSEFDQLKI